MWTLARRAAVVLTLTAVSVFSVASVLQLPSANAASGKSEKQTRIDDWFSKYDQVRKEAQMSDAERDRSRQLMTQGLTANFIQTKDSAQDKAAANALLRRMIERYAKAAGQMAVLPQVVETKKLHQGYSQYFKNAGLLFSDYLKVQNNLFATDTGGAPLLGQMQQRKADLEALDLANKDLDSKMRGKFGIAAYPY